MLTSPIHVTPRNRRRHILDALHVREAAFFRQALDSQIVVPLAAVVDILHASTPARLGIRNGY
ncbi:MAG: hypothetical protein ACE5F6_06740 [Anaerolineae bacterium]